MLVLGGMHRRILTEFAIYECIRLSPRSANRGGRYREHYAALARMGLLGGGRTGKGKGKGNHGGSGKGKGKGKNKGELKGKGKGKQTSIFV